MEMFHSLLVNIGLHVHQQFNFKHLLLYVQPVLSSLLLLIVSQFHNARLPTEAEIRIYLADNPVDTPASNIGFKNFHQLRPTLPQVQRDGKIGNASNGGVWEWTSTFLTAHEGYSPS